MTARAPLGHRLQVPGAAGHHTLASHRAQRGTNWSRHAGGDPRPGGAGGTTVARASLHNWDQISRLDLCVGDDVLVEKAGEIIPQIVTVVRERRSGREAELSPIVAPTVCPVCGDTLYRRPDEVALRCPGTRPCRPSSARRWPSSATATR